MGSSEKSDKIGFWSAAAIGVGGMVGGGIFAVPGLSVQLAHGGTPVAFALAGAKGSPAESTSKYHYFLNT